jgi:hypothetical protein
MVRLSVLVLLVCSSVVAQTKVAETAVLTQQGVHSKEYLISLLEDTVGDYLAATGKATEAQWHYKPAPDKWSMADVTEHLILSEIQLYSEVVMAFNAPPRPDLRTQTAGNDSRAIDFILEEGKHVASKMVVPLGSLQSKESLLRALRERREMSIDLVRSKTEDELRTHVVYKSKSSPTPVRDAYQDFLVFALHVTRHMRQVDAIQGSPNYPRSH